MEDVTLALRAINAITAFLDPLKDGIRSTCDSLLSR